MEEKTIWQIVILTILLFGVSFLLVKVFGGCAGGPCVLPGTPFEFYKPAGHSSAFNSPYFPSEMNYFGLFGNIIYWSIIAFSMMHVIKKINTKLWLKSGIITSLSYLIIFLSILLGVVITGHIPFQDNADGILLNLIYLGVIPMFVLFLIGSVTGWLMQKIRE